MPQGTYVELADAEAVARTWCRGLALPGVASKVFFGMPKPPPTADPAVWQPNYPLITITRVGGGPDPDLPSDDARIQFDVWAKDKGTASAITTKLVANALAVNGQSIAGGILAGALVVMGPLWRPDQTAGVARYVVDVQFTIHPDQS
jgi:hypothetical protein